MRRTKKILCGVLVVILVGLAAVVWWQWDNLKALKHAAQYSSEELEQQLQENQQLIQDAVNTAPEVVIRDVTEEEREALKDGTLTQEELIDRLVNTEPPAETPADSQTTTVPSTDPAKPEQPEQPVVIDPEYQQKISAIIAEVYVLREQYTIQLDNMYAAAKQEYIAMPKHKRAPDKLTKWAAGYVTRATKLEKNCDASMDDVVRRMEELIRANKGDLSLVDTVVYTYANEKSLKKAFYMSKLEEKGLV